MLAGKAEAAAAVDNSFKNSRRSVPMLNSPLSIFGWAVLACGSLCAAYCREVTIELRLCNLRGEGRQTPSREQRWLIRTRSAGYSSGVIGRVAVLTAEGSSRSLRYRPLSAGCGILNVASRKFVGTGAVCVNCGSDATESIR